MFFFLRPAPPLLALLPPLPLPFLALGPLGLGPLGLAGAAGLAGRLGLQLTARYRLLL